MFGQEKEDVTVGTDVILQMLNSEPRGGDNYIVNLKQDQAGDYDNDRCTIIIRYSRLVVIISSCNCISVRMSVTHPDSVIIIW